ncbi:hypothetical protein HYPBUDRAFT_193331 [Hyphopichia burtonii NRRL Y-1933]|uniref:Uncharacterized protein n=1 Tax=Hyphopichia burtonii NRRL Y-1933 TaxID=984485 RepID=A0A1E4RPG6_9ASCO|nr:hypothetical protein HYPBUDRAFT_193331 [Hyphopichia burtonii NRRL Y-1933]ODV68985.1 hypothetical protein HYPBUDRAFT_193331 [Hyphopichia burtonii NRRL Y-1933]
MYNEMTRWRQKKNMECVIKGIILMAHKVTTVYSFYGSFFFFKKSLVIFSFFFIFFVYTVFIWKVGRIFNWKISIKLSKLCRHHKLDMFVNHKKIMFIAFSTGL